LPQAEVSFNHLGQIDHVLPEDAPFGLAPESSGPPRSFEQKRPHLLEIGAIIAAGRLQVTWSYSESVHRRDTVEQVATRFTTALRALIAHCVSPDARGYTPSDFPDSVRRLQRSIRCHRCSRGCCSIASTPRKSDSISNSSVVC
jgi:non-ribosomal peptide synthase protein (TIGR01720 family)